MDQFLEFLRRQEAPVVLVGHNIKKFDWPFLRKAADVCGLLDSLVQLAPSCLDTLLLFRETHKGLDSYKQEKLYADFVKGTYDAHDAMGDVCALQRLLPHAMASPEKEEQCTFELF